MIRKTLALVAAATLISIAPAQGFRGGMGMMRTMQSKMAAVMLLGRDDVQAELKVNEDQKGKLDALKAGARDRFRTAFTEVRNTASGSPEEMQKAIGEKMQSVMEDMSKETLGVLDDAQRKRLTELAVQSTGSLAVLQPDVAKALDISPAQKVKIDELQRLQDEANGGLWEKVQSGEMERDEIPAMMQKNSKIMDESVAKILSDAQRAKLKQLGGIPFAFKDPKPGTAGAWGRPGGG